MLCNIEEESHNHLFFKCSKTVTIWKGMLNWLGTDHRPQQWEEELGWLVTTTTWKGWRATLLKMCIAETIYCIWRM